MVAALVFVGPHDGRFYIAPYKIVLKNRMGVNEAANPFIIDLETYTANVDGYRS